MNIEVLQDDNAIGVVIEIIKDSIITQTITELTYHEDTPVYDTEGIITIRAKSVFLNFVSDEWVYHTFTQLDTQDGFVYELPASLG